MININEIMTEADQEDLAAEIESLNVARDLNTEDDEQEEEGEGGENN